MKATPSTLHLTSEFLLKCCPCFLVQIKWNHWLSQPLVYTNLFSVYCETSSTIYINHSWWYPWPCGYEKRSQLSPFSAERQAAREALAHDYLGACHGKKVIKCHIYIKWHVFRACHEKMSLNSTCTSNDMFFRACHGKMPYIHQMTCCLGACHGKMALNAINRSNNMCFRGVSREMSFKSIIRQMTCFRGASWENVIKFHIHI